MSNMIQKCFKRVDHFITSRLNMITEVIHQKSYCKQCKDGCYQSDEYDTFKWYLPYPCTCLVKLDKYTKYI